MFSSIVLAAVFISSVLVIAIATPVANKIGLVDRPGGHKQHTHHTPLVGGVAILLSVFLAWLLAPLMGLSSMNSIFFAAAGLLFTIGLVDDSVQLSVRLRLVAQVMAALLLVYSKVVLEDLGYLLTDKPLALGLLAIPLTIFATVGAINALNMIDGVDGLAGLTSLVSFCLLAVVSHISGDKIQFLISICVIAGLCAFLLFNMPMKGREKAHIFMGDAGSTLLGFILAYLLISLSQGGSRAMSPVSTLWIFAIPLLDTLGVMIRRVWLKKSPFTADRGHIHHLLLDAGFRVRHAVLLIAALQLGFGVLGLAGFYLGVPDIASLIAFIFVFLGYVYLLSRPWRAVPKIRDLHRKTGLTIQAVRHIYVDGLSSDFKTVIAEVDTILGDDKQAYPYEIYRYAEPGHRAYSTYALIDAGNTDSVKDLLNYLRDRISIMNVKACTEVSLPCATTRQYVIRQPKNDRRHTSRQAPVGAQRRKERRVNIPRLIYCSRGREPVLQGDMEGVSS